MADGRGTGPRRATISLTRGLPLDWTCVQYFGTLGWTTLSEPAMADPRAFISFDFDHDDDHRILFAGQGKKDSPTPFYVQDWSSKSALPQAQWEKQIADRIGVCDLMVVLVGQHMATATGVARETQFADVQDVPFFGVYVNGGGALSTLPPGLARNRTIPWEWAKIAAAIKQMLTEGKHKK